MSLSTDEIRRREILVLLFGLKDPSSILSILNVYIIQKIARHRCRHKQTIDEKNKIVTYDPDKGLINSNGGKPAVILADGSRFWYKDDKLHRDGDEPAVIWADGTRYWYKDGAGYTPNKLSF